MADSDEQTHMVSSHPNNFKDTVTGSENVNPDKTKVLTKFSIWKNHIIICFDIMLLFTAHVSFESLQSSLNSDESLGTAGLAVLYASFSATSLLLVVFTTSRFSIKRILVCSMTPYVLYVCTGFYTSWATVIPITLLLGIGAGHLAVSFQTYIAALTHRYADISDTTVDVANNIFFGIFYGFLALRHTWGNLVSSLILLDTPANETDVMLDSCGIDYCPRDVSNYTVVQQPTDKQLYSYIGILLGFECTAVGITALFLTDIRDNETSESRPSPLATIKAVFVHMYRSREQQLLVFVTVYHGLHVAFIQGYFNMAFVSCPLGIGYVGLITITFGTTSSLLSFVVGKVATYTGVVSLFITAFVAHGSVALTMLFWKLDPDKPEIIFVMIVLWGIGDSVISPLVLALYSSVFHGSNNKTAFCTFNFLMSLGFTVSFVLASVLCMRATVIVMLVWMAISLAGVIILHRTKR